MRFETPYNKSDVPPHRGGKTVGANTGAVGSRKWNSWWSRRSPNLKTNDSPPVRIGIDAGSKTLKLVTLDANGEIVHGLYHRHRSDVRSSLAELVHDIIWRYGDMKLPVAVTGSAGIALAEALDLPFVQEVIATSRAVEARYPQADCIVELGGEDAKITYLSGTPEHRMNASCAGGTGDFIDSIASMLGCKTREISRLALGSTRTYPIASRCAVFAQTDVRPLINAGVPKSDIAQSALEAVVNQTLGGLACGRPICGNVVFLGGPLEHIPALLMAFKRQLGLSREQCIKPLDAHLFTAMGAILAAEDPPTIALSELEHRLRALGADEAETGTFEPLFENEEQVRAFEQRHKREVVIEKRIENVSGPLFLGLDAGSTTVKYALIDTEGALVTLDYRSVDGDTFATAREMLSELLASIETNNRYGQKRYIARTAVTGYGEDLLRAAFGFDDGVVETVAHLKAARHFHPDVSFMLDIGGQDMKALWVRDGCVVDAVLNEACSSGCGAFVQSCAKSLSLTHDEFSRLALRARHPIDLGAKCTVFMTSRVRHAQKTGAAAGDIAAGIAYSIANNVMSRLIGADSAGDLEHAHSLGDNVVVQGGAFKSDAVLRAFEKLAGIEVIRPNIAHLMGAFGAALFAREQAMSANGLNSGKASSILTSEGIRALNPTRTSTRCNGCGNACLLSIVDFGNDSRFITGNRCERASEVLFGKPVDSSPQPPNVVELEQKLLARFGDMRDSPFTVGLMNTMNTFESIPFWHTLLTNLGFSVLVPNDSRTDSLGSRARETIPSESVCYPAKLSHVRYAELIEAGADVVLMPRFERYARCPIATLYADALASSIEDARIVAPKLASIRPRDIAQHANDRAELFDVMTQLNPALTAERFNEALETALKAQEEFECAVRGATGKALEWLKGDLDRRAVVLASRPYHADPALLHDIDRELARLGFAVIPQLGFASHAAEIPLWAPAKDLIGIVEAAARNPQIEVVALRSFGCGFDAVSFDEARERAQTLHRPFTELKIDEIADTAHVRIRLRTLAYTSREQRPATSTKIGSARVTPDLCSTAKALVDLAIGQLEKAPDEPIRLPRPCLDCLTDALPFELQHLKKAFDAIEEQALERPLAKNPCTNGTKSRFNGTKARLKVGLLGNPLLVFHPEQNDNAADLLCELGCEVIYPELHLIEVEDVRYLEQLERFRQQGVERVIYLQSFGCLKGHVQSRGAARELARRFPDLPITIIDYDTESSALNRENRIRLAVS